MDRQAGGRMNFWPVGETLHQLEVQILQNYNRHTTDGGGGVSRSTQDCQVFVL